MKKPFLHAFAAALYIVTIVLVINIFSSNQQPDNTIIIPITMLGLLVLSVAVMGFLFLSEPFSLYMEGKKKEAITFFTKVVAIFSCFVIAFAVLLLLV